MTARDFAYFLQGLFEIGKPTALDAEQTDLIRRHLAMVFIHEIDPSMGPKEHQEKLNEAHAGAPSLSVEKPSPLYGPPEKLGGYGPNGVMYRC